MCLWRLIAKRRADEILRQQYGLVCKQGCSYTDLILYAYAKQCTTVDAGPPPFSDTPPSPDVTVDCSEISVTIADLEYGQEICDTTINVNFLDSINIISVTDGTTMIGEEKYVLVVNGSGSLRLGPDTYLHAMAFIPSQNANAKVGTTPGADDILWETPLVLNSVFTHVVNTQLEESTTLSFSGYYTVKVYTE